MSTGDGTRVDVEAWRADAERIPVYDWGRELHRRILVLLAEVERLRVRVARAELQRDAAKVQHDECHHAFDRTKSRLAEVEAERDDLLNQQPFRVAETNRERAESAAAAAGVWRKTAERKAAQAHIAEARVAAVEAVAGRGELDEIDEPWIRVADLRAALAHATPSDAPLGEVNSKAGGNLENAGNGADRDAVRLSAVARFDAAVAETLTWCGPFGYPGVGEFIARRDEHIRARLAHDAPRGEVGRCGDPCQPLLLAGTVTHCRLPHGHLGWHKGDDGSEWTHGDAPRGEGAGGREGGSEATERDLSDFGGGNGAGGSSGRRKALREPIADSGVGDE